VEANYEQRYTFLPGVLSGFGTSVNWTYVDSSIQVHPGQTTTLPATSRNTGNVAVFWERDGLNLRLSSNYMSRNVVTFGSSAMSDVYSEARSTLDFGASYQFSKHLGAFASVKNLTNTPLKYSQGTSDRLIQRELYGQTIEAGLTMSF
jgi:outer membrane receptor protein involved in Fe transport